MGKSRNHRDQETLIRPKRWITAACLVLSGALLAGGLANRSKVRAWLRGETNLLGEPDFDADHPGGTGRIAWREVHASLLPAWMMAQSRRPAQNARVGRVEERALHAAHRAYARLRYALSADRNLVELFDELDERLREDPVGNARRIDYLLWAYNDYLDRNDVPWRIEATMHVREDGRPAFYTRSYEVLTDLEANAGRLRLVRRVDLTNIDEGFLGHTTGRNEGALVMMSQTLQFGVRHVWPLLHAALDERLPPELRAIAPFVRQEASLHVPAGHLALLQTTAVDELALIEVADSIHSRNECGSSFRVYGLPWNGLAAPDQRALVDALGRSQNRDCPEVTLSEAARLLGASQRLGETKDLHDSVEYLTTWVAGAVSAHELRHAADKRDGVLTCRGCPAGMDQAAKDELSAYLASFAVEGYGYVALAQACSMEAAIAGSPSPHAQALALALSELLEQGCRGPMPSDLYSRAAALQTHYFGERERVELPSAYPRHVRLLRR